ncbi:uncharacterized protein ACRADG_005636 [Cochliomyia hominivorax]
MITDRNKLNFVTIQWLWFLCLILVAFSSSNTWLQYAEATQIQSQQQHQQSELQPQQQQQIQQQQLKSTLQQEVESNGPLQQKHQQQQQQDVTVRNFSPRMDYNNNEWRPVGRGDPLKNDPTFDYSPPTLDRVRYWAEADKDKENNEEVSSALVDAKLKKANPGKNEILLLGVTGDRMRGAAPVPQHANNMLKNAKGEIPLLQPKYTSIRRSYYAHQLPTHLMPPPMQPMVPAAQQQSSPMQQSSVMHQSQQQQATQHQQHQVHSMHMVKPAHSEYRHNMPSHSYMTSSPSMSSMGIHSKPYYMTTATQPWMHHTSSSPMMGSSSSSSGHSSLIMPGNSHRYSHPYSNAHDSHHQESVNYVSYHSHPSLTSTPSIMMSMNGMGIGSSHHEIYSPNSIRGSSSSHKSSSTSSRKPWIHDLLKKEFIKPVKPTHSPNSYHVETIKSSHVEPQHFEPIIRPQGISTTYAPVTFVTPTIPTTTSTTPTVYITTTTQKQTTTTSPSPMYSSTTMHTTHAPRTTTTLSPTRLLIPNTSNLAYRPTVAPVKMTTDSLFSHYNQPEKPLKGPMYLIIEGHSKVKTYGKDELDPHKPKIVPIIPKREPVVRIADPNEKRGTPETFQVKHLHTKTTKPLENTTPAVKATTTKATTAKPATTKAAPTKATNTKSTTAKPSATKATKAAQVPVKTTAKPTATTTTVKPKTTSKVASTSKPTTKKPAATTTTSTTTTVKPATAKMAPKLSVTTTSTTTKPKVEKTVAKKTEASDLKMSAKTTNPNALETPKKPSQALVTEPPTGMQGLLSFLDYSLDSIFKEETLPPSASKNEKSADIKDSTTKLKPIPMKAQNPQQIEARVSTKLEPIKAEDYEDYVNDNYFQMTTEYIPRETRQVFDYDNLPESRINLKEDANFNSFLEQIDDEDDLSAFNLNDEYEEYEDDEEVPAQSQGQSQAKPNTSNNKSHNIIKRIDSLVSSSVEDDFDDFSSLVDDDLTEDDLTDLARNQPQQQQQQAKKA